MAPSTSSSSPSPSPLNITNAYLPKQQSSRPIKHDVQRRQRKPIAKADLPPPTAAPETETQATNDEQEQDPQPLPSEIQSNDGLQGQDENTAKVNESERSEIDYLPQLNETIARLMAIQMQPVFHESTLDVGRRRAELKRIMGVRKAKGKKEDRNGRIKGMERKRRGKVEEDGKKKEEKGVEKEKENENRKGKEKEKEKDNMKETVKEELEGDESVEVDGLNKGKGSIGREEIGEKEGMKRTTTAKDDTGEDGRTQVKEVEDERVKRDDGDTREQIQVGEGGAEKKDQIGSENCKKLEKKDDGGQIMTQRVLGRKCAGTKSTHGSENNIKDLKQESSDNIDDLKNTFVELNNSNDKVAETTTQTQMDIIHRRRIQEFIELVCELLDSVPQGTAKRTIADLNTTFPHQLIDAIRDKTYGDELNAAYYKAVEVYIHGPDALASAITKMFGVFSRILGFGIGIGDTHEVGYKNEGAVSGEHEDGGVGVEVDIKCVEDGEEIVGGTQQDTMSGVANAGTKLEKVLHLACGQPVIRGQSFAPSAQEAVLGTIAAAEGKGMKREWEGKAKGRDLNVDHEKNKKKDDSISGDMVPHADLSISELLAILNKSIDRLLEKAKKQEENIGIMIRELRKSITELDSL